MLICVLIISSTLRLRWNSSIKSIFPGNFPEIFLGNGKIVSQAFRPRERSPEKSRRIDLTLVFHLSLCVAEIKKQISIKHGKF